MCSGNIFLHLPVYRKSSTIIDTPQKMKTNAAENTGNNKKWLIYLLVLITLSLFGWLAFHVKSGGTFLVDDVGFAITMTMRNNFLTFLMQGITFLGSSFFLLPANILVTCWLFFLKKNRLLSIHWAITSIGGLILMYFFKGLYERPRPLDPYLGAVTGFSFPSGHTLNGLVFFGLLVVILWEFKVSKCWKFWGTTLLILIILGIGLSRVYLRVHYTSDVLGALLLGVAWLTISGYFFRLFKKRNKSLA